MAQSLLGIGIQAINKRLTNYLSIPGDDKETILQKKIWWILNVASVVVMFILYFFLKDVEVPALASYIDLYMFTATIILLLVFIIFWIKLTLPP